MSPHREDFEAALTEWRKLSWDDQVARIGARAADREPDHHRGRVRVGLWSPSLVVGGAERWQESLVRAVDRSRVSWQECCITGGMGATDPAMLARMESSMPVSAGPVAARAMAEHCDVIVSWSGNDPSQLLSGLSRRPWTVYVSHMPPEAHGQYGIPSPVGFDAYAAVSELAREALPECHRANAKVIPNGIDVARVKPRRGRAEMRRNWGVPECSTVVLYLGRLSVEKDPFAAVRLARADPSIHVVLAGIPGPGTATIRDREPANLRRVGPLEDAGSAILAADWVLVPSWYESFGYTILEAWSCGVPVIATPTGLAKIHPGLVRTIRVGASGEEIKQSLDLDRADIDGTIRRAQLAIRFAWSSYGPGAFADRWTEYLCSFRKYEIRRTLEVSRLRIACPDSEPDDCGCSDYRKCHKGRGRRGYADRPTCETCLIERGLLDPGRKLF